MKTVIVTSSVEDDRTAASEREVDRRNHVVGRHPLRKDRRLAGRRNLPFVARTVDGAAHGPVANPPRKLGRNDQEYGRPIPVDLPAGPSPRLAYGGDAPEEGAKPSDVCLGWEDAAERKASTERADDLLSSAAIRVLVDPAVTLAKAYELYQADVLALDDGAKGGPVCADLPCLRRRIRFLRVVLEITQPHLLPDPGATGKARSRAFRSPAGV